MGILWFSMVSAYTFEVANRNPFGVLNLSKLIIKPTTTTESMVLSGYTLHIKTEDGKLYVHEICDENGEYCKTVWSLWQGWWITILDWQEWHICTKSWDNLVCNTTGSDSLDLSDFLQWADWHLCRRSGNKLICNGRFWNGKLQIHYGSDQYAMVPETENWIIPLDGTWVYEIYIPKIPYVTWSATKFCKLNNSGNIECNDAGTYTLPLAASGTRWGIQIWYTQNWKNYPVVLNANEQAYVYVPWEPWQWVDATWSNDKRCKYQCGWITQLSFKWNCNDNYDCNKSATEYTNDYKCDTTTTNQTCIEYANNIHEGHPEWILEWNPQYWENWDCSIVCFEEEPTGTEGWTRQLNTSTQAGYVATWWTEHAGKVRKVDDYWEPGWGTDATSDSITYTAWSAIEISTTGVISAKPNTKVQAGIVTPPNGLTNKCRRTSTTWEPERWSCSAGWGENREVWIENIYYGGSYQDTNVLKPDDTSLPLYFYSDFYHSGAFNFYTYNSTNNASPSTRITFDQKWVRIWNGVQYSKWAWLSVGWMVTVWIGGATLGAQDRTAHGTTITIHATWATDETARHFEIYWNQELSVWTQYWAFIYFTEKTGTYANFASGNDRAAQTNQTQNRSNWLASWVSRYDLYNSYLVGINTTTPKATLDVKWSIKVWSDCSPATCTGDTAWTIL